MNCKYCGKELKPKGVSHQLYCKENPNRKVLDRKGEKNPRYGKIGSSENQYTKARKEGKIIKISDKTREKIRNTHRGKKYSDERKQKISEMMKAVAKKYPASYSASKINGRTPKIEYKGVLLDGQWEVHFATWCDNHSIKWEKNLTGFEYLWNGKRIYYPDFYLPDQDLYIEIKGFERERDIEKWKSVKNLKVLKLKEINEILRDTFKLDL